MTRIALALLLPLAAVAAPQRIDAVSIERGGKVVPVAAFRIDETEVSNGDWRACVAAKKCKHVPYDDPRSSQNVRTGKVENAERWKNAAADDQPVVGVTAAEAAGYCKSKGARLPSEAEFEAAARAGGKARYPWGDEPPACDLAVYKDCQPHAQGVAVRLARVLNARVIHLVGNAAEWVSDRAGKKCVAKGGSWASDVAGIDAGARQVLACDGRFADVGFRCVRK